MTASVPTFSVLLASEDQLQVAAIGLALAAFRKTPLQDAMHEAKACWGVAGENLSSADADRLIDCLAAANVKAIKLAHDRFPPLPPVATLAHAAFTAEGFSGVDEAARQHRVCWSEIRVIGAAGLKSHSSKTVEIKQGPSAAQKALSVGIMMATGLPISVGPKKKTVQKTVSETELFFALEILAGDPVARIRIFADRINYTTLKERMLYNAMGNFKVVLGDVVAQASQARAGKGVGTLLKSQPVSTMGYEDITDLEKECRWLFALGGRPS